MSDFKVEKGVRIGRRTKYPWPDMEPGDSFLVPWDDEVPPHALQKRVHSVGARWCQNNRPDLAVRTRLRENGVRVWLVTKGDLS